MEGEGGGGRVVGVGGETQRLNTKVRSVLKRPLGLRIELVT